MVAVRNEGTEVRMKVPRWHCTRRNAGRRPAGVHRVPVEKILEFIKVGKRGFIADLRKLRSSLLRSGRTRTTKVYRRGGRTGQTGTATSRGLLLFLECFTHHVLAQLSVFGVLAMPMRAMAAFLRRRRG
jgi:hypothetical protein